jgi:voltage-gated potassium channel
MRKSVYKLLNLELGRASRLVDYALLLLILLNVAAIILESVSWINALFERYFLWLELFSVVVFSVEYALRVWSIVEKPEFAGLRGRMRFVLSPGALIDLAAIAPFYLVFLHADLRFVRVFRLLRILRVLKIARYMHALDMIVSVYRKRKEQLVISVMLILFMLVIASTVMFYIENEAQPDRFTSIPETMWWGVATLTTIGYGDMYPITPLGHFFGSVVAILGIGLFALPAGILTSGFAEELAKKEREADKRTDVCVHCGKNPHS